MLSGFNPFMNVATQRCHSKMTTGTPEVHPIRSSRTKISSSQLFTPSVDRDQTVSQRSKPNSRTTLIGEQPNPWDLLQPQDVTSRHRGAKPRRRYELLGAISLLSLTYLLSVERWQFHIHTTGSFAPTFVPVRLVSLTVKHPSTHTLYAWLLTMLKVP